MGRGGDFTPRGEQGIYDRQAHAKPLPIPSPNGVKVGGSAVKARETFEELSKARDRAPSRVRAVEDLQVAELWDRDAGTAWMPGYSRKPIRGWVTTMATNTQPHFTEVPPFPPFDADPEPPQKLDLWDHVILGFLVLVAAIAVAMVVVIVGMLADAV